MKKPIGVIRPQTAATSVIPNLSPHASEITPTQGEAMMAAQYAAPAAVATPAPGSVVRCPAELKTIGSSVLRPRPVMVRPTEVRASAW
eukprot:CAMPEP_0173246648 /NCGR_PEP_ID=MMETSP1142-20121109/17443_1 /TAXON_ID=483371 /ORGANISM="non described non described, Strain CCMP2298" /LENGTH=87 /DNA_ID=CAMNT_0014178913 /DNA_START=89 /DNA_END=349 /DNA_ORIENTATION=+